MHKKFRSIGLCLAIFLFASAVTWASTASVSEVDFPKSLDSYGDQHLTSVYEILKHRVIEEPFNLVATILFIVAILHTFVAGYFRDMAHAAEKIEEKLLEEDPSYQNTSAYDFSRVKITLLHFLGEVEAVFGLWVLPLLVYIIATKGYSTMVSYLSDKVHFTEPLFVVIIMALASSRPVVKFAEAILGKVAGIIGGGAAAWWYVILTIGPLLGSFITEPGAMTICAMLLGQKFYEWHPSIKFRYATIGLLFVNVSIGGVLTHFAAPPVLMVAGRWGWDTLFMLRHFGVEAMISIFISTSLYFLFFRKEFQRAKLDENATAALKSSEEILPPWWITAVHIFFLTWTVINSHHPVLFVGGFLFYIAFVHATSHHQEDAGLRGPIMVGFFLAGLVVHGGCQSWWIAPVLSSLGEWPLMIGATILTSFNDNAAITYLASLVPNFSPELKHAVMAGAVTGGGLTVIANAPNPAGQSILQKYFNNNVSPVGLFLAGIIPTIVAGAIFMTLKYI